MHFDELLDASVDAIQAQRTGRIDIDLAALIYTSGSTGTPKGVMLTHLNIVSAATSITTYLENVADDVILNVLPLSFDYGLYQVLMAFKVGATLVLERSFTYPHAVLETDRRGACHGLSHRSDDFRAPPSARPAEVRPVARALRHEHGGGAADHSHSRAARGCFLTSKLYSMYGLTECKRVSYLPPEQIDIRPTSVGRGMPNEEVYIVDERGPSSRVRRRANSSSVAPT